MCPSGQLKQLWNFALNENYVSQYTAVRKWNALTVCLRIVCSNNNNIIILPCAAFGSYFLHIRDLELHTPSAALKIFSWNLFRDVIIKIKIRVSVRFLGISLDKSKISYRVLQTHLQCAANAWSIICIGILSV